MAHGPSEAAVREQLDRILASQVFGGSDRLRAFLRFIVDKHLSGRGEDLKEYLVAVEVYGRKPSFDPKADAIVRVEATRLRARLKQYYQTEGTRDALVIEMPKGSYAPAFQPREAAREGRSIVVLPFDNMSADPENEYFSDGLTEEIINALTRIDGLRVVARTSAFQYKSKAIDVRRIGTELNVNSVLEGSVRRAGDRLRVTAQLIDATNGCHLWSEVYEHQMRDVFAIQDEISRKVVGTLRVRLAGESRVRPGHDSMEAYHLYLKGRHEWNKRTRDALTQAISFFEEALRVQPDYALAYAGIADSYTLLGVDTLAPPSEVLPKAKAAAQRALALNENLAESHVSLALALGLHDLDWDCCERHLERALELQSGSATAQYVWGAYLALRGRLDQALAVAMEAVALDPVSVMINRFLAATYLYRREFDAAIEQCRKTIALDPAQWASYVFLGRMYLAKGANEAALSAFQKARKLSGDDPFVRGWIGLALAGLGRTGEARQALAELQVSRQGTFVPLLAPMLIHIGLAEFDQALECLEQVCREHYAYIVNVRVDPVFDPLREQLRFRSVLSELNLADPT
jgi:serine/threonine-protein kinase